MRRGRAHHGELVTIQGQTGSLGGEHHCVLFALHAVDCRRLQHGRKRGRKDSMGVERWASILPRCGTLVRIVYLQKRCWLFRYVILASIPAHFQPILHEISSYSMGYKHTYPAWESYVQREIPSPGAEEEGKHLCQEGIIGRLYWPFTCASAASAWGSQNVMSMAR
jgi:hypothetical protein